MSKWVLICALTAGLGILAAGVTFQMADTTPHGPYHLDFTASLYHGKVTIDPGSIRLLGMNGGECVGWQYDRTFEPQVVMSIGGKQISLERMKFA
jgi:hypothetical protein